MVDSAIDRLARLCGIGDTYENFRGEPTPIGAAARKAILAAMGYPADDAAGIERARQERECSRWRSLLPPVAVVHPGSSSVEVTVDDEYLGRALDWVVALEEGGEIAGRVFCGDLAELERGDLDGRSRTRRGLVLPSDLPHGYHALRVVIGGDVGAQCSLISAPRACFEPKTLHDGRRLWGVAVQLYTLRSRRNWGIGDFADLEQSVRAIAPAGASFIGLNPLHALFPANPWHFSPYSPSSRYFLNVLYIAVERVPEFAECAEARGRVAEPGFQAELERLRATTNVDYPGVAAAKMPLLQILFRHFAREHLARGSFHAQQFRAYLAERGEPLRLHALHDAIDGHLRAQDSDRYWGWPVWPDGLGDPSHHGVREFEAAHADEVSFHAWLQWRAEEQLGAVQRLARELGMAIGLYGDYAVGVNPSGSETWSDQALYRRSAGVGAPPDALALMGQDWGIPPQDPNVLEAEGYRPFSGLIAANLRHFGALRLDHIMALYRQWWVPLGLGANDGGYVHYPLDDLMSVLALESERRSCLVVGEDLGTVPREMSLAMGERAVYSYRVLLFEKHGDGSFRRPDEYPRRAIATVTTHDLPTLAGYWSGNDIELRERLGLYPGEQVRLQVADERARDREALLAALASAGLAPAGTEALRGDALSRAVHVYLARSASALVALQIEDLVAMTDPVNVPGTSDEHPNWQRKMSCGLEDIFASASVLQVLDDVQAARTR
jgi:4-alpha-glucanotransferase